MQVEAIYDQGRIELTQPLHLRHPRVRVLVLVADEEVVEPAAPSSLAPEVLALAQQTRARLDAVRNAPLPPDDELPPVTAKTRERIRAFAHRRDR
jgi:hypothetical protein